MINRQQLELNLGRIPAGPPNLMNRLCRRSRAKWWFSRMHEIVEGAREWSTSSPQRPLSAWNVSRQ